MKPITIEKAIRALTALGVAVAIGCIVVFGGPSGCAEGGNASAEANANSGSDQQNQDNDNRNCTATCGCNDGGADASCCPGCS